MLIISVFAPFFLLLLLILFFTFWAIIEVHKTRQTLSTFFFCNDFCIITDWNSYRKKATLIPCMYFCYILYIQFFFLSFSLVFPSSLWFCFCVCVACCHLPCPCPYHWSCYAMNASSKPPWLFPHITLPHSYHLRLCLIFMSLWLCCVVTASPKGHCDHT